MPASELVRIDIWKGNRTIDTSHVETLAAAVGRNLRRLATGYHVVQYEEPDATGRLVSKTCIVDGQHRARVLRDAERAGALLDFDCIVEEQPVADELAIIVYFNQLNNAKPQQWDVDTTLISNHYIAKLSEAFNTKERLFRQGRTRRPYISCDAVREVLLKHHTRLSLHEERIKEFVARVQEWNADKIRKADIAFVVGEGGKDADMMKKCVDHQFMLGFDPKLSWIAECL